jgi:hypothetical protein
MLIAEGLLHAAGSLSGDRKGTISAFRGGASRIRNLSTSPALPRGRGARRRDPPAIASRSATQAACAVPPTSLACYRGIGSSCCLSQYVDQVPVGRLNGRPGRSLCASAGACNATNVGKKPTFPLPLLVSSVVDAERVHLLLREYKINAELLVVEGFRDAFDAS